MRSPKPRILIFTHAMHIGGVERSLIGMLRAMSPACADVDLLLLDSSGELLPQVPSWVRILPVPAAHQQLMVPVGQALASGGVCVGLARLAARSVVALRKWLGLPGGFLLARSHRYAMPFVPRVAGDYDLAISYMMPHDLIAQKVSAKRRVGWIHTDYTSVETGVAVAFERRAWESMDLIISISDEVTASFLKVFPSFESRIKLIENLLDPSWVRQRASEISPISLATWPAPPTLSLCSVGRLTHQKGFDIAIQAAERLRQAGLNFRWHVIGYGPDETMLRRMVQERNLEQHFVLTGPRENPYPFMKACDIYVQPSRYEGKAVSIREAQMLGKPVLVSDFATVRSQIEHRVDGYIATAGVDGLVDGILKLAGDPALRDKLAHTTAGRDYGNLTEIDKVLALVPPANV